MFLNYHFSYAVNVKNNVNFWLRKYEINELQTFNSKLKRRQLLRHLWFNKADLE